MANTSLGHLNRITPAYAGKSGNAGETDRKERDHPRLCGEKLQTTDRNNYHWGSPPPMRGKVARRLITPFRFGITPAYAGKRYVNDDCKHGFEDHPRLCGEKAGVPFLIAISMGSPPPMRGKALYRVRAPETNGITPAYAGKSKLEILTR